VAQRDSSKGNSGARLDVESDESLARRVQGGDGTALEQLVRRYIRRVHAIAAALLPEPADVEDAAQDTFLRALRGIEAYDPRRPFAPWLYQIARNVARNEAAMRARWRTEVTPTTLPSPVPGPDAAVERLEIRQRVGIAMARLPDQQRSVFHLSDVEGYATDEIARMMDLSPGTVRSHLHHARKALRIALAETAERLEQTGG
jgi:RNA polymerase sigma-70 factor (ECF subfamily)